MAVITLSRPEVCNAINIALRVLSAEAVEAADANRAPPAIVISGAGNLFSPATTFSAPATTFSPRA